MPQEAPHISFNRPLLFEEGNNEILRDFQKDIARQPIMDIGAFTSLRAELLPPSAILPRFTNSELAPAEWTKRMISLRYKLQDAMPSAHQPVEAQIANIAVRRRAVMIDLDAPELTNELTYLRDSFAMKTSVAAPSIRIAACAGSVLYVHTCKNTVRQAFTERLAGKRVLLQPVVTAPELSYVWVQPRGTSHKI